MRDLALELSTVLTTKPQAKETLQMKLRCNEREVREAVTELRKMGYNVASNSGKKGYWLGSEEDKLRTVREYRSRAREMLEIADAIEKGPDCGQMEMEV